MKQRGALVLMGGWLAGTVCMSVVATENFYTIDRLLAGSPSTPFTALVHRLGQPQARELLRYLSSELNRLYFQLWNVAQLVIGALVLWLIDRGQTRSSGLTPVETRSAALTPALTPASTRTSRLTPVAGVIAMLAVVVLMLAWLTPAIVSLGRSLDFVPRDPSPPGMQRFWILHAAYTSLEMLKLVVGLVVIAQIARASTSRTSPAQTST
jgi:hypothetical protein